MTTMRASWRMFGLGAIALGAVCLVSADFVAAQPLPKDFPWRAALAFATAAFLLATGIGLQWRRTTALAAAALSGFYALAILASDVPAVLANAAVFGLWSGCAEQVAMLSAALIVDAASAQIDGTAAARLTRASQVAFGACALLFGGAHFVYMNLTAPLVPTFLPPSQQFWAVATGIAHIAAGVAIIAGVQARLAAMLLAAMYASFTPLVHLPMLLAHPHDHGIWTENAINLALTGAAWVVATSLARPRP
jgi:uncharacterized membrane protein